MTSSPPAVVVSSTARTVEEARREIHSAREAGADMVEVRFDRFSREEIGRAAGLFPSPLPLIATLRSAAEGGEGPDDPSIRAELLQALSGLPFQWVDLELARDMRTTEPVRERRPQGWIVSTHSSTSVSAAVWSHLIRTPVPAGCLRKVVVPASVGQTLRDLIPDLPPPLEVPLVALTTGPSGQLLRAWSRRFGFPLVFAAPSSPRNRRPGPSVEPSQIPVDWIAPYLRADDSPPLFGLAGHPVAHSRSPELHETWLRERGDRALYLLLDYESDREFVESIPALIEGGFRGLNVTQPLKQVALELATDVRPGADSVGVANVLTFEEDRVLADNTDQVAIIRRLEELRDSGLWDGGLLGLVGAGGAARATLGAARELHAGVVLWARRDVQAAQLAREFGVETAVDPRRVSPSLVVNATSVGRAAAEPSPPQALASWVRAGVHVLDWVYSPEDPILKSVTLAAGGTYEDGSRLLVYQAAATYGLWWGEEPTDSQVRSAVEAIE